AQPVGIVLRAEVRDRRAERLAPEHGSLRVVELAEARIKASREGIRLQKPQAEAVDRRDPRTVELPGEIGPPAVRERCPDPGAKLARGPARVRDDEDRV